MCLTNHVALNPRLISRFILRFVKKDNPESVALHELLNFELAICTAKLKYEKIQHGKPVNNIFQELGFKNFTLLRSKYLAHSREIPTTLNPKINGAKFKTNYYVISWKQFKYDVFTVDEQIFCFLKNIQTHKLFFRETELFSTFS